MLILTIGSGLYQKQNQNSVSLEALESRVSIQSNNSSDFSADSDDLEFELDFVFEPELDLAFEVFDFLEDLLDEVFFFFEEIEDGKRPPDA